MVLIAVKRQMMNRYITAEVEDDILELLKEWESGRFGHKLTWNTINKSFGYSRQALSGNHRIKLAFDEAKLKLKQKDNTAISFKEMEQEIKRLNQELSDAHRLLDQYKQRYIRWQTNAQLKGISVEQLNKPIPLSMKEDMRRKMQNKHES